MWHSRPPRDPPPFMANAILSFHFDYPHPSLRGAVKNYLVVFFSAGIPPPLPYFELLVQNQSKKYYILIV